MIINKQLLDSYARLTKKQTMKKLFFTLIVLSSFSLSAFSQTDAATIAKTKGQAALEKSKVDGIYEFTMPAQLTADDVAQSAKYYVHYFSVNFDEASHKTVITMIDNEAKNRIIIMRFLVASGVKSVLIDGKEVTVHDFKTNYLE